MKYINANGIVILFSEADTHSNVAGSLEVSPESAGFAKPDVNPEDNSFSFSFGGYSSSLNKNSDPKNDRASFEGSAGFTQEKPCCFAVSEDGKCLFFPVSAKKLIEENLQYWGLSFGLFHVTADYFSDSVKAHIIETDKELSRYQIALIQTCLRMP